MQNVADAITLAEMTMPQLYRQRKQSWWERTKGRMGFATPGPKPRFKQITYRGAAPPSLHQMLIRVGEYRRDPLSWDTLNLMRKHPVIKLATVVRAAPIMTALREAKLECEEPKIKGFIQEVFVNEFLLPVAKSSIIPSYIYGVAPHEKVWENRRVKATYVDDEGEVQTAYDKMALVYKKIKFVHPESLKEWKVQPETGDFDGFVQKPRPGDTERAVDAWKAFVYVNRFLYGGFWGESEYVDIYPYWYYAEFFRALQADYLRFKAVPPMVGYAPPGVRQDQDGNDIDNLIYAGEILQQAYSNLVIMLPFEVDEQTGKQKWSYEELNTGQHSDVFTKAIEELEVGMLRGMIVPERTVTQNAAAVGSYNQAEQHAERMLDAAKMETDEFINACNKFLIPQLIEDNFGPRAAQSTPCKLVAYNTSEALKTKLYNIVITVLQNDREGVFRRQVAFTDLLRFLNIPFTKNPNMDLPDPIIDPNAGQQPAAEPADDKPESDE